MDSLSPHTNNCRFTTLVGMCNEPLSLFHCTDRANVTQRNDSKGDRFHCERERERKVLAGREGEKEHEQDQKVINKSRWINLGRLYSNEEKEKNDCYMLQ